MPMLSCSQELHFFRRALHKQSAPAWTIWWRSYIKCFVNAQACYSPAAVSQTPRNQYGVVMWHIASRWLQCKWQCWQGTMRSGRNPYFNSSVIQLGTWSTLHANITAQRTKYVCITGHVNFSAQRFCKANTGKDAVTVIKTASECRSIETLHVKTRFRTLTNSHHSLCTRKSKLVTKIHTNKCGCPAT